MSLLAASGALLGERDRIALAGGLAVRRCQLQDQAVSAVHRLHPQAASALRLLRYPTTAGRWYRAVRQAGLDDQQIAQIIDFLQAIGGLQVQRSMVGKLAYQRRRWLGLLFGLRPVPSSTRWPATNGGVARGVSGILLPLAGLIAGLAVVGQRLPGTAILMAGVGLVGLSVGIVVHEITHVQVIRRWCPQAVVLRRGLRLGVLHGPITRRTQFRSALLGPLMGALVSLSILLVAANIWRLPILAIYGCALAGLQLCSWLPMYGDGQALRQKADI